MKLWTKLLSSVSLKYIDKHFLVYKCTLLLYVAVMAELRTTTVVVLLNGGNYPIWKIHCKMALMNGSLWRIVTREVALDVSPGE